MSEEEESLVDSVPVEDAAATNDKHKGKTPVDTMTEKPPEPVEFAQPEEAKVSDPAPTPPLETGSAAAPQERLSAELLALFDAPGESGDKKSQAAALIATMLKLGGAKRDTYDGKRPDDPEPSARVDSRTKFMPHRPSIDFTKSAGPTSSYDALKRPGS